MELLRKILSAPVEYENDAVLGLIAEQLIPKKEAEPGEAIELNSRPAKLLFRHRNLKAD